MSRFVRSLKDDRADEFRASSYAQFARIITPYLAKSLPKLADLVNTRPQQALTQWRRLTVANVQPLGSLRAVSEEYM